MTAYLQPGDNIHLVFPSTGDMERDAKEMADLRASYAHFGVNIVIATISGVIKNGEPFSVPEANVVSVFRRPTPTQGAAQ